MSKYRSQMNAGRLIKSLTEKGFINNPKEVEGFVVSQQEDKELPLYMRALVGVGAFIASLCFIGFLFAANIINYSQEVVFVFWGFIFMLGAVGLQKISGEDNSIKHSFFMQTSFSLMAVGKTLFVWGMVDIFNSRWGATIALFVVSIATYHVYRMSIDRFLSSFATLFSFLVNILWGDDSIGVREVLFNGFFLLQLLGAAVLVTNIKIKRDYIPLAYGFVFSLCVSTLFLASYTKFGYWQQKELIPMLFVNMLLASSLIVAIGWIAGGLEKLKSEPLFVASIGAVFLGAISVPGLIYPLC